MRATFAAALLLLAAQAAQAAARQHQPQEAHQHRLQKTAPRRVVQWHTEDSPMFDAAHTTHDWAAVSATAAAAAEVTDVQVVGFGALLGPVHFPNATVPPNESKTDLFFTPDGVHIFGACEALGVACPCSASWADRYVKSFDAFSPSWPFLSDRRD